jgi:amino acid transporter, AAT family
MNTVILSTVLSAGNHALFAGTRLLYSLAKSSQAPKIFAHTSRNGVPWPALLATSSGSALCFATSRIGKGELWFWLQNLVGVSNQVILFCTCIVHMLIQGTSQIAWLSIGLASWRFRKAWLAQEKTFDTLLYHPRWTRHWGPPFVVSSHIFFAFVV